MSADDTNQDGEAPAPNGAGAPAEVENAPEGAVADPSKPVVMTPDEFRDLARAQERFANQQILDRLVASYPVVAALVAERDDLKAQLDAATKSAGKKSKG